MALGKTHFPILPFHSSPMPSFLFPPLFFSLSHMHRNTSSYVPSFLASSCPVWGPLSSSPHYMVTGWLQSTRSATPVETKYLFLSHSNKQDSWDQVSLNQLGSLPIQSQSLKPDKRIPELARLQLQTVSLKPHKHGWRNDDGSPEENGAAMNK